MKACVTSLPALLMNASGMPRVSLATLRSGTTSKSTPYFFVRVRLIAIEPLEISSSTAARTAATPTSRASSASLA
jgi:hypothetical protein